jgi:hypothetical protein
MALLSDADRTPWVAAGSPGRPDLGAIDSTGAAYGYEGLYCIDSSISPTSLGVTPSLTISAVCGRVVPPARPAPPTRHRHARGVVTGGAIAGGPGGDGRLPGVGERR